MGNLFCVRAWRKAYRGPLCPNPNPPPRARGREKEKGEEKE
jgi:hypothetical protein